MNKFTVELKKMMIDKQLTNVKIADRLEIEPANISRKINEARFTPQQLVKLVELLQLSDAARTKLLQVYVSVQSEKLTSKIEQAFKQQRQHYE